MPKPKKNEYKELDAFTNIIRGRLRKYEKRGHWTTLGMRHSASKALENLHRLTAMIHNHESTTGKSPDDLAREVRRIKEQAADVAAYVWFIADLVEKGATL